MKKEKAIKAWAVCARRPDGLVPLMSDGEDWFSGKLRTIYFRKENALKDWDGWGFMADLVEVEIRPVLPRPKDAHKPTKKRGK